MFPTFIGLLDIQSWWEVPSIAHFCSLFRAAFNLLDFDIEDLEEALLTDGGTEGHLVQELIVRLLEGCLPNDTRNDISTFNYQMFLRRLFRKKCQEYKCENPFNTDVDFELLPLRQKVEILRALCDFRLDAEDVEQSLSNLDSDSLRVEPLGHDRKNSAYWYFYGTRLYREDYTDTTNSTSHKQKSKPRDRKRKRRRNRVAKEEEEEEEKEEDSLIYREDNGRESVWQVVCFTQQDWSRLVDKFRDSEYDTERKLYRTLSEDFIPEIPKLFDLKEKQQRHKLLQRNSTRALRSQEPATPVETVMVKSKIKTKSIKGTKKGSQSTKSSYAKEETPPPITTAPVAKKGRQTNNSLASAVGQIVIHTRDEVEHPNKKKGINTQTDTNFVASNYNYKYGYSIGIEEEERRVGMHKVLECLKDHVDAWPFIDPVDEEYAPRYYSVVRKPMDLSTMEEKLDGGSYKSLSQFKKDFRLIVDNCRQYNGSDNEYTEMAINLKEAFDKAVSRYLESELSSDEESTSPKSAPEVPELPVHASRAASPQQSTRKRSKKSIKKSTKKSKLYKSDNKSRSKASVKIDEEEKRAKNVKEPKKKKVKKKNKKGKNDESPVEDDEEEEEPENDESASDISTIKTKEKPEVNVVPKSKKVTSKELAALKNNDKKLVKERHEQKKEAEVLKPIKESKDNKRRKEDFEEDLDSLVPAKSKSRKIEKKELEQSESNVEHVKKSRLKKSVPPVTEEPVETIEKQPHHIKAKKNRKKEKTGSKITKSNESSNKERTRDKEKKLTAKEEDLQNGELKSKKGDTNSELNSFQSNASQNVASLVRNKEDLESLDSLKDKIVERRREDKLKHDKQKKSAKTELHMVYSKKVPSNGSTFHESEKINTKRPKVKKGGSKEEKAILPETTVKNQEQNPTENKKGKVAQIKHHKSLGKEENPAIQALNQATEQTLHDINKWLDDAPRLSEFSSGNDSPVLQSSTEPGKAGPKTDIPRKRPSSIKIFGPHGPSRPKKIQRTIDRLQPGKSKGNLLLKKPLNIPSTTSETTVYQSSNDNDQGNKDLDQEPKLSLGTVLKNVDSIQLICKSLVSSPNPNLSNDDDEEDHIASPVVQVSNFKENKLSNKPAVQAPKSKDESKDTLVSEETQKPKTATPNLSAWFKAFGAPKSKKKDEESEEVATKKDGELPEVFCGRQRRLSTGGSSVSESVSSFSQESSPGRPGRSPQGQPVVLQTESQIRGAGFYQDALSTGSSPYNSPYYTTPPRYSAQLPPTPSPQNHPLSPAYPSPAPYEQPPVYSQAAQSASHQTFQKPSPQEGSNEVYHQVSPTFSQRSPKSNFQSSATAGEPYGQELPSPNPNPSPVYPQHSPQAVPPPAYPQPSPQTPPSNYSQPSPQQPPTPKYSQLSPQHNSPANYSAQPSPQAGPAYSQPSPQQQRSPYSQASPQALPTYSQPSPQQQHSPFGQASPQPSSGFAQLSPQPPPASYPQPSPQPPANYSAPSPQPPPPPPPPPNYSQPSPQPPSVYAQRSPQTSNFTQSSPQTHSPGYSQPSPQALTPFPQQSPQPRNYSQPSPQQTPAFPQQSPQTPPSYSQPSPQNPSYSQTSPQQHTNYSQPSPQQSTKYSHPVHSPQAPQNYSQVSPRQTTATNYSQSSPSPQQPRTYSQPSQPSPQQKGTCSTQSSQQPSNYTQPSPQPISNYSQVTPPKTTEEYPQNPPINYPQGFKQNHTYGPSPAAPIPSEPEHQPEYTKPTSNEKPPSTEQQRNFVVPPEAPLSLPTNHQIYQSVTSYPAAYANNFSNIELQRSVARHNSQDQQQQQSEQPSEERTNFTDISESLNAHKYTQQRAFLGKTPAAAEQLQSQDQSNILAFQQNLTAHESLYQTGFQPSGYTMPNTRPMYPSPHYFDTGSKTANSGGSSVPTSSLPPVKKRIYNDSSADVTRSLSQESSARSVQEQYGFDPMMALPQPDAVSASQFDGAFVGNLVDSVVANPTYARLGLGLVGRTNKEQQQLLTIPRPPTKPDHLSYSRAPTNTAELDLNLLQSLQSAAAKSTQSILSVPRKASEASTSSASTTTKAKKIKKSKQQQQQQQQQQEQQTTVVSSAVSSEQVSSGLPGFPQYTATSSNSIGLKNTSVVPPPAGSAFNFAAPTSTTTSSPFYDKDPTAAAAAFAFLDEFRNPNSYYSMALRQQQQQQQQVTPVTDTAQPTCNKLTNQPPRNFAPHPFLHSAQRSAAYGPPVSAYVAPHAPNLAVDPAAYQQYIHSFYALQPPPHHHRPSWL